MELALTFDAEFPDRDNHDDWVRGGVLGILEELRNEEVPATFFIQGRWAQAYPDLIKRIALEGHSFGNHTYSHVSSGLLSPAGFRQEVLRTQDIVQQLSGYTTLPYFRSPYGAQTSESSVVLEELGYKDVLWDWTPADWDPIHAPEFVERWQDAKAGIVLMHTWPTCTVEGLKKAVQSRKVLGDTFVELERKVKR